MAIVAVAWVRSGARMLASVEIERVASDRRPRSLENRVGGAFEGLASRTTITAKHHRLWVVEHGDQRPAAEALEPAEQAAHRRLDALVGNQTRVDRTRVLEPRREERGSARGCRSGSALQPG